MLCAYMRDPADPRFGELESRARTWHAPILPVDDHGPFDLRLPQRLANICRRHQPVIWHGHDYKSNLLGLLLEKRIRPRLITTVHGWVQRTWKTPLYYAIDRLCLRHYEHVICVSEDLHRRALALGVPEERCSLIPNAIDLELFRRSQTTAVAQSGFAVPHKRLVVGAVGRLSGEKGFHYLIRAAHQLVQKGRDLEVWIAGEGRDRPRLAALAADLGLGERVKLLGYRSDIIQLFQAMDIFALSSVREGLPNVVLEAMALEVPVVATRIAGVPSLIREAENGLLVRPGSALALAAAIERLFTDDEERRRLGRAARATVEESFSFQARMEKIGDIYDLVLDRGDQRRAR